MTDDKQIVTTAEGGIDHKIIVAFERISQALRTMAWNSGKQQQLNPVQSQLLIFLLRHPNAASSITALAREFGVSKASLSETVSALEKKGLINKAATRSDLRNFNIRLMPEGLQAAAEAAQYTNLLTAALGNLPAPGKEVLFDALGSLIFELHNSGVVPVQRMCLSCHYHEMRNDGHFCRLLEKQLAVAALQVDCADHIPAKVL